jgi:hypothetical protein
MVFSQGLSKSDMGWGIGIPCKKPVKSTEDLICEAEFLWAAEQSKCSKPGPISAKSWGCVGLLTNPEANACFSRKIRNAWSERVRRAKEEEEYPELPHATGECSIVSKDGILNIPWPTTEDGNLFEVDILLATANKPTFCDDQCKYAKPRQIAEAWNERDDAEYFRKNRKNCIITFEDDCIEKHLK